MGLMNFLKIGGKHYVVAEKPKLTPREALSQIHAILRTELTNGPIIAPAERQRFEKINVSQYTDEQVTAMLKQIKALVNQKK